MWTTVCLGACKLVPKIKSKVLIEHLERTELFDRSADIWYIEVSMVGDSIGFKYHINIKIVW